MRLRISHMSDYASEKVATQLDTHASITEEDAYIFGLISEHLDTSNKYEELVAMLAFSQYARQKHEFLESYKRNNEGKLPSEKDIKTAILSFKDINNNALQLLIGQARNLLDEMVEEYAQKSIENKISAPVEKIVKENTNFSTSVGASMVASFVYSLIFAMVLFIATAALPNTKFSRAFKLLLEVEDNSTELNEQ